MALFPFLAVDRASPVQRALAAAARVPWLMAALGTVFGWLPARFVQWVPRRLAGARCSLLCVAESALLLGSALPGQVRTACCK